MGLFDRLFKRAPATDHAAGTSKKLFAAQLIVVGKKVPNVETLGWKVFQEFISEYPETYVQNAKIEEAVDGAVFSAHVVCTNMEDARAYQCNLEDKLRKRGLF